MHASFIRMTSELAESDVEVIAHERVAFFLRLAAEQILSTDNAVRSSVS